MKRCNSGRLVIGWQIALMGCWNDEPPSPEYVLKCFSVFLVFELKKLDAPKGDYNAMEEVITCPITFVFAPVEKGS